MHEERAENKSNALNKSEVLFEALSVEEKSTRLKVMKALIKEYGEAIDDFDSACAHINRKIDRPSL